MLNPTQRRVTGKGNITTASVDNPTQKLGAKGAFAVPDPIPYTLSWANSIRAPLPNPPLPHQSRLWEPSRQFVNLYPMTSAHPWIALSHISVTRECLPISVLLQTHLISVAPSQVIAKQQTCSVN